MKSRILFIILAIASSAFAQTATDKATSPFLKSDAGRFVFGQIGAMRADQFMLDTQTGRLWQIVVDKEGIKKLQPVPYIQIMGSEAYVPEPAEQTEGHRQFTAQQFLKNLENAANEKK